MPRSKSQFQCRFCNRVISASVMVNHLRSKHKIELEKLLIVYEQQIQLHEQKFCSCGKQFLRKNNWLNCLIFADFAGLPFDNHLPKVCSSLCRKFVKVWNAGLTKKDHPSIEKLANSRLGLKNPVHVLLSDDDKANHWRAKISKANKGRNLGLSFEDIYGVEKSLEIKNNQSIAAKKRKIHGHLGKKHTEQTKKILATKASEQMCRLKRNVSAPQQKLYERLRDELGNEVLLEHQYRFYVIDIAYKNYAIEVDGDFFHVNESQGFVAKYAIQKRNIANDKAKNSFLQNNGWNVIRIWEHDINTNFENVVLNILKQIMNEVVSD